MKTVKVNIRFYFLSLVLLFQLQFFEIKAQPAEDNFDFKNQFQQNLNELEKLYCFTESDFYPGNYKFKKVSDLQEAFEKLQLNVFSEFVPGTQSWFSFLENLNLTQKQNLVRCFSFYEQEFETILGKSNLPKELKYLPAALSAMNAKATQKNVRSGLWQLSHFQAILCGAQINKLIDERLNPGLSTIFAARQLATNLSVFETPDLAISGYLAGNTRIKNAMIQAGEEAKFEDLFQFLPLSAQENIAAFQAVAVFLSENRFMPETEPFIKRELPDSVAITELIHFKQISKVLSISEDELAFLNPQFKFAIIHGEKSEVKLALPHGKWDDFVLWQDSINDLYDSTLFEIVTQRIEYPPAPNRQYLREPVKDLEIEGKTKIQYRIKSGDVLGIIAEKYDVKVTDLKYWNNIYNERKIQAGQKLDIFIDDEKATKYATLERQTKKKVEVKKMVEQIQKSSTLKVLAGLEKSANKIEHVVKSGESPYLIAKKYEGVSPEDILEWNGIDNARKIQIGQKLIVYIKK